MFQPSVSPVTKQTPGLRVRQPGLDATSTTTGGIPATRDSKADASGTAATTGLVDIRCFLKLSDALLSET